VAFLNPGFSKVAFLPAQDGKLAFLNSAVGKVVAQARRPVTSPTVAGRPGVIVSCGT
jgi:hypothetical protein